MPEAHAGDAAGPRAGATTLTVPPPAVGPMEDQGHILPPSMFMAADAERGIKPPTAKTLERSAYAGRLPRPGPVLPAAITTSAP